MSGKYGLEEDRKQAVLDSPMPKNAKGMQRFLGVGVFFNEFIPDYATKASKLYDMIKPTFNWNTSTWLEDYEAEFEKVKLALAGSVARYFPDYV